ncbi:MAG: AIR synthase-related protein, partial [candidate division WOR-3 bacterium]
LNTDVFCFAHIGTPPEEVPDGVLHPRRVMRGVVAGVRDYGNRMGIPTANGAVYFDQGFMGNPLVFCGTVGLIPRSKLKKRVRPGQVIVLAGGRTGRDGIHGVTFASLELGQDAEMSSGAVQIGNPIEEKKLADVVLAARDRDLFSAITDCGGGGLSSAVGELASGHGCEVWLDRVPLKYPGLTPAEIWISEAQERMIMFVEPARVKELLALAEENDVEATPIGRVTGTKRLVLKFRGRTVADLGMRFLHRGWRAVRRVATWRRPDVPEPLVRQDEDLCEMLLKLLESPNIASKEWVTRQYDHEVQAGSVVKPFCGVNNAGPTDACVVRPLADSQRACVVACGLRPRYGLIDPYWMAASAIDEALRNCVAVGGDIERTALLDNFCWGSPERPEQLGGLVRAAEACYDIARGYRVPFISGKDSLYNEFRTEQGDSLPIPPTLLVSALSVIADGDRVVTMDLKKAGSLVYVVGETFEELGGSEFFRLHQGLGRSVPTVDARRGRRLMRAVGRAIRAGLVAACHDASEGGLGVALAEMAFAGGIGLRVSLRRVPGAHRFHRDDFLLFSESNTRFVCEVPVRFRARFERVLAGIPRAVVGRTIDEPRLVAVGLAGSEILRVDLNEAERRWRRALTRKL